MWRHLGEFASWKQHLHFNMRTKRYNIIPKKLMVKHILVKRFVGRSFALLAGERFLKARIYHNVSTIKQLNTELYVLKKNLRTL